MDETIEEVDETPTPIEEVAEVVAEAAADETPTPDPPAQEGNGMNDEAADEFLSAIDTPATGPDLKNLDDLLKDLDL